MATRSRRLTFRGADGQELVAILEEATEGGRRAALLAHCFTCSKDLRSARQISGVLAAAGIPALRLDFTGIGESGGEFSETSFSTNVDDIVAAADLLRSNGLEPSILVGHSLGGTASIVAAARIPEVRGVVAIGSSRDTDHLGKQILRRHPELATAGEAEVRLGPGTFRIRKEMLDALSSFNMTEAIANLGRHLLVIHSPEDRIVPFENALEIFEAARQPKSLFTLEGADHLLLVPRDAADRVGRIVEAWARPYLEQD